MSIKEWWNRLWCKHEFEWVQMTSYDVFHYDVKNRCTKCELHIEESVRGNSRRVRRSFYPSATGAKNE
jgi:hypothetical protein